MLIFVVMVGTAVFFWTSNGMIRANGMFIDSDQDDPPNQQE